MNIIEKIKHWKQLGFPLTRKAWIVASCLHRLKELEGALDLRPCCVRAMDRSACLTKIVWGCWRLTYRDRTVLLLTSNIEDEWLSSEFIGFHIRHANRCMGRLFKKLERIEGDESNK